MKNIYNDKIAESYYKTVGKEVTSDKSEQGADIYLESLLPESLIGKKVLDLGCGNARHSEIFCDRGADSVVGLDLSVSMIEQAKSRKKEKNLKNLELVQGDIENMPFSEKKFDFVFSRFSLMYGENIKDLIMSISKAMNKDGELLIEANIAKISDEKSKDEIKKERVPLVLSIGENSVKIENYAHEESEYLEAFQESGMEILDKKNFDAKDISMEEGYKYKDSVTFEYVIFKLKKISEVN